jgi:hypothetical protein
MATNPIPQAPWGEYIPQVGRMTVEQFEQFPSVDGWMYELHQGRLITIRFISVGTTGAKERGEYGNCGDRIR